MHVAEAGPADGPAVVLCHGFPECWYSWRHQLEALGDAGYHVLAPDQRGYGTTDRPLAVEAYTQLHLVGDIVGVLDAFGIDDRGRGRPRLGWTGRVALRAAASRPLRRGGRAQRALRRGGAGADAPRRAHRGDARRARRRLPLRPLLPGAGRRRARARRRPPPHARRDPLRAARATSRATSTGSSTRRRRASLDVVRDLPGPLPWLSDADLDVFVESFSHHGTFAGGINWYRNIDRNQELLAAFAGKRIEQPALFIGAEHDSIFGQTPGGGAGDARRGARAARSDVDQWVGPLDPAGATRRGQRRVAGRSCARCRAGETQQADRVGGRGDRAPDRRAASATACSTSSTLVGERSGS